MTEIEIDDDEKQEIVPDYNGEGALAIYIKQAKRYPVLSREEELEVITKAVAGDLEAKQKIINSNLLLVVKIAYEYKGCFSDGGLLDLIQEGNLGALRALEKFDLARGLRFSTYCSWWVRSFQLKYMFNNSQMIRPGTTSEQKKLFYNLRKEQNRLEGLGIDADASTIAANLNVSEASVIDMDSRLRNDFPIDATTSDEEGGRTSFLDFMASPNEMQPDIAAENNDFRAILNKRLEKFALRLKNDKHRTIFFKRIISEEPETLQNLGDECNFTRERSRQIEAEILIKLKRELKDIGTSANY